jgi:hypothetical protein
VRIVLPLPRFLFKAPTLVSIAVVHVYLSVGHLSHLVAGEIEWTHIWKGFGALIGVYVFAALAARAVAGRRPSNLVGSASRG